jgi:hypothetical protein
MRTSRKDLEQIIAKYAESARKVVQAQQAGNTIMNEALDWAQVGAVLARKMDEQDLARAQSLARVLLRRKVDKAGRPMSDHAARVAARGRTQGEKVIGWLHDVVEDTDTTVRDLEAMGFADYSDTLDAISRRQGEPYFKYIERVKQDPLATRVKLHDIADHLVPRPGFELPASLVERYKKARRILENGVLPESGFISHNVLPPLQRSGRDTDLEFVVRPVEPGHVVVHPPSDYEDLVIDPEAMRRAAEMFRLRITIQEQS